MTRLEVIRVLIIFLMICLLGRQGASQDKSPSESPGREPLSRWSRQWIDEVVPYIITTAEKGVFLSLPTEEGRGKFIAAFWNKRDPDPRTEEDEFKLDYYKRIALANTFLGVAGMDGWRTDRGKSSFCSGRRARSSGISARPARSATIISRSPRDLELLGPVGPGPSLQPGIHFRRPDRDRSLYAGKRSRPDGVQKSSLLDPDTLHHYFDYQEYLARAARNPFEDLDKLRGVVTTQVSSERPALEAEETGRKVAEGLSSGTPVGGGEIELSEIILKTGAGGDPASGTEQAVGDASQKPGLLAGMSTPVMERVFRVGDELEATIEIHNMSGNPQTGRTAFQVEYSFYQHDALVASLPASRTEATADRDCRIRTSLRLKNFKPGRYRLRATVRDLISGVSVSRDTAFSVIE